MAILILFLQEQESFEEADHNVDEWRAREIAKSIARSKVSIAKVSGMRICFSAIHDLEDGSYLSERFCIYFWRKTTLPNSTLEGLYIYIYMSPILCWGSCQLAPRVVSAFLIFFIMHRIVFN